MRGKKAVKRVIKDARSPEGVTPVMIVKLHKEKAISPDSVLSG